MARLDDLTPKADLAGFHMQLQEREAKNMAKSFELDELWLNRIKDNLNGLAYGIVQIVVHDGQIVQIERTERQRFDAEAGRVQSKSAPPDSSNRRPKQ
jgi:hypothetical protein